MNQIPNKTNKTKKGRPTLWAYILLGIGVGAALFLLRTQVGDLLDPIIPGDNNPTKEPLREREPGMKRQKSTPDGEAKPGTTTTAAARKEPGQSSNTSPQPSSSDSPDGTDPSPDDGSKPDPPPPSSPKPPSPAPPPEPSPSPEPSPPPSSPPDRPGILDPVCDKVPRVCGLLPEVGINNNE